MATGKQLSAEERFRLLAENSSDIVYQTSGLDIEWISPSVTRALGWLPEELIGRPAATLVSSHQDLSFVETNRDRLEHGQDVSQELLIRSKDGSEQWYSGVAHPLLEADGTLHGFVVGMRNIHNKVQTRLRLQESEEKFRTAMVNAAIAVAICNAEGRVVDANAAMTDFLARESSQLRGQNIADLIGAEDPRHTDTLHRDLLAGSRDSYRTRSRSALADGFVRHGDLSVSAVRSTTGEVQWLVYQVLDMTEQVHARERLTELATIDTVTGLPNRPTIAQRLAETITDTVRWGGSVGVLLVGIDRFRTVNDTLGHQAGDALLREIGIRLRQAVGQRADVGRYGSDEFVLVIPGAANHDDLAGTASAVRAALGHDFEVRGRRIVLTSSMGAAISTPDSTAATVIEHASVALSEAKRAGRAQLQVFDEVMASAAAFRLKVESELRAALDGSEFAVYYQPVIDLGNRGIVGHEALVRWQHPVDGLTGPASFIGVAEDSGLIVQIGQQVLRQVCVDIAANALTGTVAVNTSAVELSDPAWLDSVLTTIHSHRVDPTRLVIELTETAVMTTNRDVKTDLSVLRNLGVGIHVDDFGTGFSSVSLLRDLPITGVKLDQSFVAVLDSGRQSAEHALAHGLMQLASSLGMTGIAEGVERPEQAEILHTMGWPLAQGYLFGRPEPLPA